MPTVGIPRALLFFRYYPVIKSFFEALGAELVVSEATSRATLAAGLKCVVAETCLPLKAYCGHVIDLIDKADFVFVPSVRSVEKDLYNCIKLFALPDQVRGAIPNAPPVLDIMLDINLGRDVVYKELRSLGKRIGATKTRVDRAADQALKAHARYTELLHRGFTPAQAMEMMDGRSESAFPVAQLGPDAPKVALLGHPYNLYDDYLAHDLTRKLQRLGIRVVAADTLSPDEANEGVWRIIGSPYWMNEMELTGAAGHFLYSEQVDGVIIVTMFGCGPDSMMIDAVQRVAKRGNCNPLLVLTLDEHTAEAGVVTRLEAFFDTIGRRKSANIRLSPRQVLMPAKPKFGKDLKLTFPHMGTMHVALDVLFNKLEIDHVVPPPCNKRSLDAATKIAPEWACVPYKTTLGNFLDALELGANAILLLTGANNCRFGYYHKLQEQALKEMGYSFQMVLPEINGRTMSKVGEVFSEASGKPVRECWSLALLALDVQRKLDAVERRVQWTRARELQRGAADNVWGEAKVKLAKVLDKQSLHATSQALHANLDAIPVDHDRDPLRICIVGEIYVVQEPFINHDIERELGKLRVEANRSEQVGDWLSVFPAVVLDWVGVGHHARIKAAERPYLQFISGETIGQTVIAFEDGYDGVIQLAPFTCTPEVVAQNVLPRLRQNVDIPIMSLVLDEQTAHAGIVTRLEAFVDLLKRRRALRGPRKPISRVEMYAHLLASRSKISRAW